MASAAKTNMAGPSRTIREIEMVSTEHQRARTGHRRSASDPTTKVGGFHELKRCSSAPATIQEELHHHQQELYQQQQQEELHHHHHHHQEEELQQQEALQQQQQQPEPGHAHYLLAIVGGVILGYALAFPGGLPSMPHFLFRFSPELFRRIQKSELTDFCSYRDHGLIQYMVMIPATAVVFGPLVYPVGRRWDRRYTVMAGGIAWIMGGIICICFPSVQWAFSGMALMGVAWATTLQSVMAVCYGAPGEHRGRLVLLCYYMMSLGGVLGYTTNLISSYFIIWGWRLSYSPILLFAIVMMMIVYWLPPLVGADDATSITDQFGDLLSHRSRPKLVISAFVQIAPPLTGIRALLFFGPRILESLGFTAHISFLGPLVVASVGICSALLSTCLLTRVGRRVPLLVSAVVILCGQVGLWVLFEVDRINVHHHLTHSQAMWFAALTLLSIVGYSVITAPHGLTADQYRGRASQLGDTLGNTIALVMMVVLAHSVPEFFCLSSSWGFLGLAPVAAIMGTLFYFFVPETTGAPVEDMPGIWEHHFFWRRFFPRLP